MPFHCPVTDSFQDLNVLHANQNITLRMIGNPGKNTERWIHLFIAFFLHVLYMTALTINYFCSSCWIIKKNYKHLTVFKFWTFSMQLMQSKTLSITGKLGKNTASDPIIIASSMSYTWLLIVPSLKNFWIVHYYPFEVNYLKVSDWARSKEEFITG